MDAASNVERQRIIEARKAVAMRWRTNAPSIKGKAKEPVSVGDERTKRDLRDSTSQIITNRKDENVHLVVTG